jgi:hypothetical protein
MPYVRKTPLDSGLGRPKGSKNKSGLERLGLERPRVDQVLPTNNTVSPSPNTSPTSSVTPKVESSKVEPKEADFSLKEESESETISDEFSEILKGLKSPEKIKDEEEKTSQSLDSVFQAIQNMWNRAGEENEKGDIEPWKWTESDSKQLKNAIMLMDAKYGFIGKSVNYIPEILFGVTMLMIVFKGFALMKHRKEASHGKPKIASQASANSTLNINESIDINELARQRAQSLGGF